MEEVEIKMRLEEGVSTPSYGTEGSKGFDVCFNKILKAYKGDSETEPDKLKKMQDSFIERGYIKMRGFERILFGTGIFVDLPEGKDLEVRPRSGTSLGTGIMITNSPGTIDNDYVDKEIGVIVSNPCPYLTTIKRGERLAQVTIGTTIKGRIKIMEELMRETERIGGYGSTGVN